MSQALVPVDPSRRSVVTYSVTGDPWPTIATWAQQHGFNPREPQTGNTKLFQKGSGLFTAPIRAQLTHTGNTVEVQAYLTMGLLVRIMALFLLPAEMNVRSGGFRAVIPRSIARKAVNVLLAQVGAELIP
jgi:hypothetical protein